VSVLRDPRAVIFLTGVFLMAVVFYQHEGAMPLFLVRDLHYRESFYGILFAVNTVLIVILEVPLNLAMQRWSHRWTLVLGATLFAVGFGSMAVLHSVPGLLLAAVVWTFGEMIAMPASGAYATDIAPPGRGGQYAGAYASTFSLAILVGPWAGTIALEAFGGIALWSGMLVVGLVGAGVFCLLRDPESAAVLSSFASLRMTAVVPVSVHRRTSPRGYHSPMTERYDVSNRGLAELPDEIRAMRELRELYIYDNQLTTLPPWIGELGDLRVLDANRNRFASLPGSIGALRNLYYLYISDQQRLGALPETIGGLASLAYLNASHDALTVLPDAVGDIVTLVELRLDDNALRELPESMRRLTRLRELHLTSNQLRKLPVWLGELGSLRRLTLRNNKLRDLPESLGVLTNLRDLDLRGNELRTVPDALGRLVSLERLDLRWNPIAGQPEVLRALDARGCTVWR
jgi:MFS family permease